MKYTVILLYPSCVAGSYGESYATTIEADTSEKAASEAYHEALASNGWSEDDYLLDCGTSDSFTTCAVMYVHEDGNITFD